MFNRFRLHQLRFEPDNLLSEFGYYALVLCNVVVHTVLVPLHFQLDVLRAVRVCQCVPRLLETAARWADVGNHDSLAVASK